MNEIREIDNRAVGEPEMKYQYFELCRLAEYPEIKIKINTEMGNDFAEADVYFDGEHIDTFIIKDIIEDLVNSNILTIKEVEKKEKKRRIKRIKQGKCPRCYQTLIQDKGTHFCNLCDMHYDNNGTEIKTIKVEGEK